MLEKGLSMVFHRMRVKSASTWLDFFVAFQDNFVCVGHVLSAGAWLGAAALKATTVHGAFVQEVASSATYLFDPCRVAIAPRCSSYHVYSTVYIICIHMSITHMYIFIVHIDNYTYSIYIFIYTMCSYSIIVSWPTWPCFSSETNARSMPR